MGAMVLDTTVLIDALRGRPAAARLRELASRREVLLTNRSERRGDCLRAAE